jgi:exodeoxyribonuclease V alpha subunit
MTMSTFVPDAVRSLAAFVEAGVLGATEVNATCTFASAVGETHPDVLLAAALAVRAPLHGSICVDLQTIRDTVVSALEAVGRTGDDGESFVGPSTEVDPTVLPNVAHLAWPDPAGWLEQVSASALVAPVDGPAGLLHPLVVDGGRLYLTRYWSLERYVAADLRYRSSAASQGLGEVAEAEVRRIFEVSAAARGHEVDPGQLAAALAAVERDFVVISGGPGTGKTTTVAQLLAGLVGAFTQMGVDRRISLVAPTGKAAMRMTEAIRGAVAGLGEVISSEVAAQLGSLEATTIHRLLGRADGGAFRHGPSDPLPQDILIVDEVSMVSLSLVAHLLAAVRPGAKVVLVGDPFQLASIEAGSVLADVVGIRTSLDDHGGSAAGPAPEEASDAEPPAAIRASVRTLGTIHRQGADSSILELATAIRRGRSDDVLAVLREGRPDLTWVDPDLPAHRPKLEAIEAEVTARGAAAVAAAERREVRAALEAIGQVKVLCARRRGPDGVDGWNRRIEGRLRSEGVIGPGPSYPGRPVMVLENDYLNAVYNGDVGVAVPVGDRFQVWFQRTVADRMVEEVRLDRSGTQWAMTIHKSQGSEFPHAVVVLPSSSRLLSRELLYTAVTRAKDRLTLVASAASIEAAVDRRVARASGLQDRLQD